MRDELRCTLRVYLAEKHSTRFRFVSCAPSKRSVLLRCVLSLKKTGKEAKHTLPVSSGTKFPARTAPGERERVRTFSTSNRGRRPARRKGCLPFGQASRFATDQAKSKIFGWSPRVLIFSERGLAPGEKIASLQIPRPEIRRISAESEKGWCGGESVPSASG